MDERERQRGVLARQHLGGMAIVVILHDMVQPDTMSAQANLASRVLAEEIRQLHGSLPSNN
jgi:hypothetical protein